MNINESNKNNFEMIGYTHIDPVWLWEKAEGYQEIKSSFASALMRMDEFNNWTLAATSMAFWEWLKENCFPEFMKLREQIQKGRLEIVGGMWVEPDADIPCGEAMIRHFLYGKKFAEEELGTNVTEGFNPDSFGHGANLPVLLRGCGIRSYTVNRPTAEAMDLPAVFLWSSPDGSSVFAERCLKEYMAWTRPALEENIAYSREALKKSKQDHMMVFYGVGNHGGGPTIDNIRSIMEMMNEEHDYEMHFSTMRHFYNQIEAELESGDNSKKIPEVKGELGRIFYGCYSANRRIKEANRKAEWALIKAENLAAVAGIIGSYCIDSAKLERFWKALLFNQFHDILAGTAIRSASESAVHEMNGAMEEAEQIASDAVQAIANNIDTRGDGMPLILVNPTGADYRGVICASIYVPRAQKKPIRLRDPYGREIFACESSYQCSAPESRKNILFKAQIPALGYAVYRLISEKPDGDPPEGRIVTDAERMILDNGLLKVKLSEQSGCPEHIIVDGYDALKKPCAVRVFYDDRGAWGEDVFSGELRDTFQLEKAEAIESNEMRGVLRVFLKCKACSMRIDYVLERDSCILKMKMRLQTFEKHRQIDLCFPINVNETKAFDETCFLAENKMDGNSANHEYCQHRFADITDRGAAGLAVINDSVYGCMLFPDEYRLILTRSYVASRGGKGPLPETLEYDYVDQGEFDYEIRLIPHSTAIPHRVLFEEADFLSMPVEILEDSQHPGTKYRSLDRAVKWKEKEGVSVAVFKNALCGEKNYILRVFETEGKPAAFSVKIMENEYTYRMHPYEILTLRVGKDGITECNMIEQ